MCLIDVFTVKFYDKIPVMVWLAYTILMQGIRIFLRRIILLIWNILKNKNGFGVEQEFSIK